MTVGDPTVFAIEFEITKAYERLSFLALGFFVIHVKGRRYGVYKPDATLLACSLEEIQWRILYRGEHTAPFADWPDPGAIADAYRSAIYADEQQPHYFGLTLEEFKKVLYSTSRLVWAPDGDEAFDDSSHVLQFDLKDSVRIIAFNCNHKIPERKWLCDLATLTDLRLPADRFYGILEEFLEAFESKWSFMPKISEEHDQLPPEDQA